MADEKSKNLTGADGPDKDPAQPEAGGSPAPGKAQKAPEAVAPEKTVKEPEKAAPAKEEKKPEIPKEQRVETPEGKEAPTCPSTTSPKSWRGRRRRRKPLPGRTGKHPAKRLPLLSTPI